MKNNSIIAYLGFGFLLGIWFSTILSFYSGFNILLFFSLFGIAVSFLGFIYFWTQTTHLKTKIAEDNDTDGDNALLKKKKPRIWIWGEKK